MSHFPDFDRSGLAIDVVADGEFLPRPHAGQDRSHIGFVLAGQGLEQAPPLEKLKPVQLEAHILGESIVVRKTRSEEHTSELQSLMRISYAVYCLKKKTTYNLNNNMRSPYTRSSF